MLIKDDLYKRRVDDLTYNDRNNNYCCVLFCHPTERALSDNGTLVTRSTIRMYTYIHYTGTERKSCTHYNNNMQLVYIVTIYVYLCVRVRIGIFCTRQQRDKIN
jgi:hypothetical protein